MNSGLPRHLKVTDLPSGMSVSLISILARANTSAAAAMDDTKCVTTDLAAYAPATPPAGNYKYKNFRPDELGQRKRSM